MEKTTKEATASASLASLMSVLRFLLFVADATFEEVILWAASSIFILPASPTGMKDARGTITVAIVAIRRKDVASSLMRSRRS